mgnify:FL=1
MLEADLFIPIYKKYKFLKKKWILESAFFFYENCKNIWKINKHFSLLNVNKIYLKIIVNSVEFKK